MNFALADQLKPVRQPPEVDIEHLRRRVEDERKVCDKLWGHKQGIS
jgi:hypothetical protein